MVDLHLLVIITCVFCASMLSLMFINRCFKRKTFEEIIAEKKALSEKIYAQNKLTTKKPKKVQPTKKDLKREKKQRQREQQKDTTEQEDSDAQSEQPSVEEEPQGLSKTHVEFDPDPEVIVGATPEAVRRASIIAEKEKENLSAHSKHKSKKEKKAKSGILVNKNEPVVVRENLIIEESLNSFETKQPKDTIELKKQEREKKEITSKKEKNVKKEKVVVAEKLVTVSEQPVESAAVTHVAVAKEVKQQEEKVRQGSPKNISNSNSNNNNNTNKTKQQIKKQNKETAATKELVVALDKLSENDTIGVSLLMNLFRRAELNRSEIQILIDYLLNKQQDMPSSHSEWSDDICQKLKRQLEEKERALSEEQEASAGIQAKLRELRTEINTERAQLNATVKMYVEKIQSKEQELAALNQEMQALNDKFALERKQFQAKLLHEKQNGSQDLLAQLQRMQNELAHKDNCIGDLTCMVNSSHQGVEDLKQQVRILEQQRDELEQVSNNRIFELEKSKTLETENAESKVEIRNLQNELESTKADLMQVRKDLEVTLSCNMELSEKQKELVLLQAKNEELLNQLTGINSKAEKQSKEQTGLNVQLDALKAELTNKEQQLADFNAKNGILLQQLSGVETNMQKHVQQQQELKQVVETLKNDLANKHKQLQEFEQTVSKVDNREKELLQQLQEQKEKNNDLRMKNWKLVEALQNAETTTKQKMISIEKTSLVQQQQLFAAIQKPSATTVSAVTSVDKEERNVREIFQRLYPEAVKACAGTALSTSFEQWVEAVLAAQLKLANTPISSSNKSTQSNSNNSNNGSSSVSTSTSTSTNNHSSVIYNSHNDNLLHSEATNNSNSRISNSANSNSSGGGSGDVVNDNDAAELRLQNTQLRAKVDELTKLVTKTSNTLSDLEGRAREQHEKWQSIILSKDEEISRLQHSNGAQDI